MYGICQDDPGLTAPRRLRYDAGIEVDAGFRAEGEIGVQVIGGGRYACARYAGVPAGIAAAWTRFAGSGLADSAYAIDLRGSASRPLELYGADFRMDPDTGAFECELCLPVRSAR